MLNPAASVVGLWVVLWLAAPQPARAQELATDPAAVEEEEGPGVVRVGAALPFAGILDPFARRVARAATLAVREVNRAGGIQSLGGARIELIVANTGLSVESAEAAVAELDAEGVVAVIGAFSSALTVATTAAAERLTLPHLVDGAIADVIVERELGTLFRLGPSYGSFLAKMLELTEAHQDLEGAKPPIIVHDDGPYGSKVAADLELALAELDIPLAGRVAHPPQLEEPGTLVQIVTETDPGLILFVSYADAQDAFLKAWQPTGRELPQVISLLGPMSTDPEFREAHLGDVGNWLEVTVWPERESERGAALFERFERARLPVTSDTVLAFEGIRLIANALEAAGAAERTALLQALQASEFEQHALGYGATSFGASGQNENAAPVVATVQDGELVALPEEEEAPEEATPEGTTEDGASGDEAPSAGTVEEETVAEEEAPAEEEQPGDSESGWRRTIEGYATETWRTLRDAWQKIGGPSS